VGIHDTYIDGSGQVQNTPVGGITLGPAHGVAGNATVSLNSKGMGVGV